MATKNKNTSAVGYKGAVTVKLKKGKKTIMKKTYHNAGGDPLFKFLSNCIISNDYISTDAPRYIKLFTVDDYTVADASSLTVDNTRTTNVSSPVCAAIYYNTGEVITDDNNHPAAYLHFIVPCSSLSNSISSESTINICQMGLYNASNSNNANVPNYCAAINLTNSEDETTFEPITISSANGDYSLFIDWTLSFTNVQ